MTNYIREIIRETYAVEPGSIEPLGGGFYGRAFRIKLDIPPFAVVVKLYLYPGFAHKEAHQLQQLAEYATLKMPEVYKVGLTKEGNRGYDYVLMESLTGENLGCMDALTMPDSLRQSIRRQVVDNLIAYHNVSNPDGFGPLSGSSLFPTWQEYYYPIACNVAQKSRRLHENGQITREILSIVERAIAQFDEIFDIPVEKSSLIHGDYNTWNILLDGDTCSVIDPFHCCWADSEFDLYQLDNANGKQLGLLELYQQKKGLSPNFERKKRFYELFTELNHYYDAHVDVYQDLITAQGKRLDEILR